MGQSWPLEVSSEPKIQGLGQVQDHKSKSSAHEVQGASIDGSSSNPLVPQSSFHRPVDQEPQWYHQVVVVALVLQVGQEMESRQRYRWIPWLGWCQWVTSIWWCPPCCWARGEASQLEWPVEQNAQNSAAACHQSKPKWCDVVHRPSLGEQVVLKRWLGQVQPIQVWMLSWIHHVVQCEFLEEGLFAKFSPKHQHHSSATAVVPCCLQDDPKCGWHVSSQPHLQLVDEQGQCGRRLLYPPTAPSCVCPHRRSCSLCQKPIGGWKNLTRTLWSWELMLLKSASPLDLVQANQSVLRSQWTSGPWWHVPPGHVPKLPSPQERWARCQLHGKIHQSAQT